MPQRNVFTKPHALNATMGTAEAQGDTLKAMTSRDVTFTMNVPCHEGMPEEYEMQVAAFGQDMLTTGISHGVQLGVESAVAMLRKVAEEGRKKGHEHGAALLDRAADLLASGKQTVVQNTEPPRRAE